MKTAIKLVKPSVFNYSDDWKEYLVNIRDLRKGDVFYECSGSGENYELIVVDNPKKTKEGWFCLVKNTQIGLFDFFVSSDSDYIEPSLFWTPLHLTELENGEFVYVIK